MVTKILIADDHQIVRQGLRFLLEKESDLKVVAEAEDGRTTVRMARELFGLRRGLGRIIQKGIQRLRPKP